MIEFQLASMRSREPRLTLGIEEPYLKEEDILFINSLTSGDIVKLEKQCGFVLSDEGPHSSILKLKKMEMHQCRRNMNYAVV